ncbi:hypothetical protein F5Y00DRAFT_257598 [Daldinia vernicosa]|uniref:uncharacterized protein n=1 Tax=Daldinia vernicosa TaxID=114800 RepID=UPI0020078AFD|nr:uncharacterized protein F5Y00DRAFT_257598 [Daldinia vernicosa]KAI0853577.1 hypothetical protein F5Y00DRAFT_257598 [Daldinia vernicosa]
MSSSNPRRQRQRKKPHGNGNDDDDDRGTPRRGKKLARSKGASRRFACPFAKAFPDSLRNCHERGGFENTSRVKEHIYRKHLVFQCPRCNKAFRQKRELDEHVRAIEPCETTMYTPSRLAINYNGSRVERLRSRGDLRNLSEEQKWFRIYETIYPTANPPYPSPYVDEHANLLRQELKQELREELYVELREELAQELRQELQQDHSSSPDIATELVTPESTSGEYEFSSFINPISLLQGEALMYWE